MLRVRKDETVRHPLFTLAKELYFPYKQLSNKTEHFHSKLKMEKRKYPSITQVWTVWSTRTLDGNNSIIEMTRKLFTVFQFFFFFFK